MEKKLNKNQLAFFEVAVEYFGSASRSVKLGDLRRCAEVHGLIVPTSFLNNFCKTSQRGVYDITQSGVEVKKETGLAELMMDSDENKPEPESEKPIIIGKSVYAEVDDPILTKIFKDRKPSTEKYSNPVYVVQDGEGEVRSVCDSPIKAYKNANIVLHGSYTVTEKQALDALNKFGIVIVRCIGVGGSIRVLITKMEMNK